MDLAALADIHGRLDALDTTARLAREADDAATRAEHGERWARELSAVMTLAPGYPAVHLRHGAWLAEAGDLAGAAAAYAEGAAATGDPELHLRRVACLRACGDEAAAEAGLLALIATPRGADDVRGHWQLAAAALDRGDPLAAWERLSEYREACPVRDAAELAQKLPALLLLLECAYALERESDGLTAVAALYPGVDAEVLRACARLRTAPQAAAERLTEALRGDPYHPWGHYALAVHHARGGDEAAALRHLDVAMRGEPALAWRARGDAAFAGMSVGGARVTEPERRGELWVAEAEPEARAGSAYLPLRTGVDEALQRAWWTLPGQVRACMRPVTGAEGEPARYLRLSTLDRTPVGHAELYRGVRALAPFVAHGRIFVGDPGEAWIDELRFVDGGLQVRRDALAVDEVDAREAYFVARAEAEPDDRARRSLAVEVLVGSARSHVRQFAGRAAHPEEAPGAVDHAAAAARLLALALRSDPENGGAWLQQGLLLRGRGELAGARAAFERAMELQPTSALPRIELADLLRAGGELAAALEHYAAAVELPDRPDDLLHRLGLTLEALGLLDEAITAYDCSIELQPQRSFGSKLNRGNCYVALQRWEEALGSYALAAEEAPGQALAWTGRGQALIRLGRLAEAEEALLRAIALDATAATPWRELVVLHFGDAPRALALCDEALARDPNHAQTWSTRGSALNNLGRFAEAHACYDRSVALDPDHWHAHYCRACSYALQGERDAAIAAAARVVELDPAHRETLRAEGDLASLRDDPRFVALVAE